MADHPMTPEQRADHGARTWRTPRDTRMEVVGGLISCVVGALWYGSWVCVALAWWWHEETWGAIAVLAGLPGGACVFAFWWAEKWRVWQLDAEARRKAAEPAWEAWPTGDGDRV